MESKRLVDPDTGELFPVLDGEQSKSFNNNGSEDAFVITKVQPGHTVKARKNGRNPKEVKDMDNFVKVYPKYLKEMLFTDNERAVLFTLQMYLDYDGNIRINGDDMNVKKLFESLGWKKKSRLQTCLNELEAKDILIRYKKKGSGNVAFIQLNPTYFCKGNAGRRKEQLAMYEQRRNG